MTFFLLYFTTASQISDVKASVWEKHSKTEIMFVFFLCGLHHQQEIVCSNFQANSFLSMK